MEELIKQIKELREFLQMMTPIKTIEEPKEAEPKQNEVKPKKKYTYPKEKIREYTRNYYLKNKEKIVARSTAYLKDKYRTDPEFKERAKGYSKAFRDRQKLLVEEARKIVLANEAKQKVAYITIYNE
jgi:hypothetical protein